MEDFLVFSFCLSFFFANDKMLSISTPKKYKKEKQREPAITSSEHRFIFYEIPHSQYLSGPLRVGGKLSREVC